MAFPSLGNSDHVNVSVSINFTTISKWDTVFHGIAYGYSRADWDGLCDHLRNVSWEDTFKLSASAAASEFGGWVQVGIDVYIPHRKYYVEPHSSLSAACPATIVLRNHFFTLYQQNKSSASKVKFGKDSSCCKRVLQPVKLAHATNQKSLSLPRNLTLGTFDKLLMVFSTKVNLLYLLYSSVWRGYLLHLIQQNCLLKTFVRTLILMTRVSINLFSLLELIWNCIIFL